MYALTGEGSGGFSIEPQTGIITSLQMLDYEQNQEYRNLVLVVFDGGFLHTNASLTITVTDENDNSPVFMMDNMQISISEATPLFSEIFVANATDMDATTNADISYSLGDREDFLINSLSGAITVNTELDYETQRQYVLEVMATDGGTPSRQSNFTLTVMILDDNDNAPVITNVMPSFSIRENANPGVFVGTINATDQDSGSNSELTFEITAGNSRNVFSIDATSGDIFTNTVTDREDTATYSLTVQVHETPKAI